MPLSSKETRRDQELRILFPSRRSRNTFIVGLVTTPVLLTAFGCFVFYRIHHVDISSLVVLIAFYLLTTHSILNQLTLKIELSETAIAVRSLFRRSHKLDLAGVGEVKVVGGVGRKGLKLLPKDRLQQPLSFAIDVLTPEDQTLILAVLPDAKHIQ